MIGPPCPRCKLVYTNNHDISSCYKERDKLVAKDHKIETNSDGTWVISIDTVTKLMDCINDMCHMEDWK